MLQHLVKLKEKVEEKMPSNSTGNTLKLYLRSMHYNALGKSMTGCPPTEWRNPFVVDGYNAIANQLAFESMGRVEYIDTNFIIGPMWDSPDDWCHFRNEAGKQDALFLLAKVLLPHVYSGIGDKQAPLRIEDHGVFLPSRSRSTEKYFIFLLWIFLSRVALTFLKQMNAKAYF